MSGLEVAAAAVVASQLLDAKYHVSEDLIFIQKIARKLIAYAYNVYRGRASFWYAFEKSAHKYPNNNAVSFPRPKAPAPMTKDADGYPVYDDQFIVETYTYKDLYDMVLRFSFMLKNDYGITSEHTIGIDCMNKPLFIIMWLALWNIGALPAFLNYNTKGKPLVHCIETAGISQVFVDPDCAGPIKETEQSIRERLPKVKLHYINEANLLSVLSDKSRPQYRAPDATRRPHDTDSSCCALIYTSGTTGLPKPAIVSWKKAFMAGGFFGTVMKIDKKSNVMTAMPLYHSTAAMLGFGDFGVGACRKYGSLINTVLSFAQAIVKMNPDDENEVWRDPSTGFCVRAGTNDPGELLMKIVNPKNVETSFQGYYGNLKATNSKIIRNVFKKGDAWFRSGDLLRMDEDGLLYFVDRLGDTFRWKSENVSATEVENELMGSGVIKQSVVVGVQVPNHEGRAGFAVIEAKDGLSHRDVLDKIYQHVSRSLPKYAIPQFVKIGEQYIQASHNHKVPKNQFKNQKLPKGDDGKELIYWLNKNSHRLKCVFNRQVSNLSSYLLLVRNGNDTWQLLTLQQLQGGTTTSGDVRQLLNDTELLGNSGSVTTANDDGVASLGGLDGSVQ
ncbi:hypothetical protein HF325_001848 [Metschnikowia pulcherrima]|uniref:AMP-dependent synthetase/ligase domain-containing protein n=1 Tax=Metschnikowia pulcherrima TaxID=27326 RepID=A0A8H7GV96_9ASCO|nr:hypothetical protein HF325_001848 [Metschnikowia pulcherrima]